MKKKILVFSIVIILNFGAFFVLANQVRKSAIDGGSISGYVRQVNGNPIVGASVEAMQQHGAGYGKVTTADDGSYRVDDLPTGDYMIRAWKSGYARVYYNNVFYFNEAEIIHLDESKYVTDIDFKLTLGGSISGVVYDNESGEPIFEAKVEIIPSESGWYDTFTDITDINGKYKIECLALGSYKVSASAARYVIEYYDDFWDWSPATDVLVNPPDDTSNINIHLSKGCSIAGYVVDNYGYPLSDVTVEAGSGTPKGWTGGAAVTDSDGRYIIENLRPWSYAITARKSGYAYEIYNSKKSLNIADLVTVSPGQNVTGINFTLDLGGSITGHVYNAEDGTPIQFVGLNMFRETGDHVGMWVLTDHTGYYTLWLEEGNYLLETNVGDTGFRYIPEWYNNSYSMENATPVSVTVNQEISGINFYLSPIGGISGSISDEGGMPISGASIYASSDVYSGKGAVSRGDGTYIIDGLRSGSYLVQVSVSGYNAEYYNNVSDPDDATIVTVDAPNETSNINFVLTQGIGVYISRPIKGALYLFDKEIVSLPIEYPIIVGKINIKAVAFSSDNVEFYVDDELRYIDSESPFSWVWDKAGFGRHTLKVVVYEVVDIVSDEITVWRFF